VPEYIPRWLTTPSEPAAGFGPDPTIIEGATLADALAGTFTDVGRYISPLTTVGDCSKIYTVNFMFQVSQQETNSNDEIARDIGLSSKLPGAGLPVREDGRVPEPHRPFAGVEGDQKVTSYFLGAPPQVYNNTFAAYAQAGGTGSALPITENPGELVAILSDIFAQILSVSTTFTSAALPVNTFDRAQVLRDVFLALFQPQVDEFPANNSYWWGNVKKLRLEGTGRPTTCCGWWTPRASPRSRRTAGSGTAP
jgi:type IV pilus assembly protein PilY1